MSQKSQAESIPVVPNASQQQVEKKNPLTFVPGGKFDGEEKKDTSPIIETKYKDAAQMKREIKQLKKEIGFIQLADTKVKNAELSDIEKNAIADDVSFAGLSIKDREEKISALTSQKESVGKKIRKAFSNFFSL